MRASVLLLVPRMELNSGLFSTYFTKPRKFSECSEFLFNSKSYLFRKLIYPF